ncbi:N-acyl homoserine lactonase family protein [Azospirillum doebereinerae]
MASQDDDVYEIYGIRYATNQNRYRWQNIILGGNPNQLEPMDFFSWVVIGAERTIVIDTGMSREKAAQHGFDYLRDPMDGLRALGVEPETATQVILTHMHFDHIGNVGHFPAAHFLLPEEEMTFATGAEMRHYVFRRPYAADEVSRLIHHLYEGRLTLHGRDFQVAPGVSVHHVGGHTAGQEVVRVRTRRGWVVLASDALHYYEEYEKNVPFTVAYNLADMLSAHEKIRALAESDDHVLPAHDPRIMRKYPAARPDLEGFVVRMDVEPQAG